MNRHTPWGYADTVKPIAPGIVWYSTASHGGFGLSPEAIAQMPESLRTINPWAGDGWYEEDCDWSIVAASFPQHFQPKDHFHAYRTLASLSYAKEAFAAFMATDAGQKFKACHDVAINVMLAPTEVQP